MQQRAARIMIGACALAGAAALGGCVPGASVPVGTQPQVVPMAQLTPAFVDVANRSPLIFAGVVLAREPVSRVTTVRATRTYKSPEPLGPVDSTDVLVIGDTLPVGWVGLFFTHGIAAGRTLVMQEESAMATPAGDQPDIAMLVSLAAHANENAAIAKSIATSDAVVIGTVTATHAIVLTDSARRRLGEHAPRWREADVLVTQALREVDRPLLRTQLTVLYSESSDESGYASARLAPGDTRVLILRWSSRVARAARHGIAASGRYFVFNAADALPASDSGRVARLLK